MIKLDSRISNFPYSKQCRKCENLKSEKKQECVVYALDIPDSYWKTTVKCPDFSAASQ